MKRYIRGSKISELALGMEVLVGQTWSKLVESIYDNTEFIVDFEYIDNPQKHIFLIDPDHNEYEAEVTRYSNGQYELRVDNIHSTGRKRMDAYVGSSTNTECSFKSSSYVRSASGVKLYVEYYPYERYGGGKKKKVNITGTDLRDALYKMVSNMRLYLYPEDIEDDDMTAEEILESIESSNGDGCDYITKLENKTTGELLLSGFDEDDGIEEW